MTKKFFLILLCCALSGCDYMRKPVLGTRVHSTSVAGVTLVHCSVLVNPHNTEQAEHALQVCKDEIQSHKDDNNQK